MRLWGAIDEHRKATISASGRRSDEWMLATRPRCKSGMNWSPLFSKKKGRNQLEDLNSPGHPSNVKLSSEFH